MTEPHMTTRPGQFGDRPRRRGTVLVATMWVLVVLTGLVLVLAGAMRIEGACSANHEARQQAAAVESGAIQYVLASLDGEGGQAPTPEDMPCEGVQIGEGAFWIIRPDFQDRNAGGYGLVDEASKLNLNIASAEMLSLLPNMSPDAAAAILDWRDSDSELSVGGAESEYYLLLPDPYECKNDPLETVEELLLIKLADAELLFGEDANRNGRLEANENDADELDPPDDRDGELDLGLYSFATVYSSERNVDSAGSPRVNVNQASTSALAGVLRGSVASNRLGNVVNLARLGRPFQSILDFYYRTGLKIEEFAPVADKVTTSTQQTLRGLINVNTAPKEVLQCLPGLEAADAAALVTARSGADVDLSNIAWVTTALTQEKANGIANLITARAYQFSADIVSVAGNGRAFRRCRVVVDVSASPPRIRYRQDLTSLGWPLAENILTDLRAGKPIETVIEQAEKETP